MNDLLEGGPFNNYLIRISDPAPLVILFGPEGSGKTMSLLRLTWFLELNGYKVVPDRDFRRDEYYRTECEMFDEMKHRQYSSDVSQIRLLFMMLVKVIDKKGRTVCQILDAPGSFFFDSDIEFWEKVYVLYYNDEARQVSLFWSVFLDYLKRLPNKRLWLFYKERDWDDYRARKNDFENLRRIYQVIGGDKDRAIRPELDDVDLHQQYVKRIEHFVKRDLSPKDKSVFVLNKVDIVNGSEQNLQEYGCETVLSSFKDTNYKGLLYIPYRTILLGLIKLSEPFVRFSSGHFDRMEKKLYYQLGQDDYPKMLWKAICRGI